MGLYLCIFDGDEEMEGLEVGSYGDFEVFRKCVRERLEGGDNGARFPTLMTHSDCDGEWSASDAKLLAVELETIEREFNELPPTALSGWQRSVASSLGLSPRNLSECFFDVDGEPLFERLRGLCASSVERGLPILFQ